MGESHRHRRTPCRDPCAGAPVAPRRTRRGRERDSLGVAPAPGPAWSPYCAAVKGFIYSRRAPIAGARGNGVVSSRTQLLTIASHSAGSHDSAGVSQSRRLLRGSFASAHLAARSSRTPAGPPPPPSSDAHPHGSGEVWRHIHRLRRAGGAQAASLVTPDEYRRSPVPRVPTPWRERQPQRRASDDRAPRQARRIDACWRGAVGDMTTMPSTCLRGIVPIALGRLPIASHFHAADGMRCERRSTCSRNRVHEKSQLELYGRLLFDIDCAELKRMQMSSRHLTDLHDQY
jgi:hypothetical protein